MKKEAEEAMQLGGPNLEKFGADVLTAIRKRQSSGGEKEAATAAAIPAGWQ